MVLSIKSAETMFSVPRLVFTLKGNKRSEDVIDALISLQKEFPDQGEQQDYKVFENAGEVRRYLEGGISPSATVAVFDGSGARCFKMMTSSRPDDQKQIPNWTHNAHWAVKVHAIRSGEGCARQVRSDFLKKFEDQLSRGRFPWGSPRKKESAPRFVTLSPEVDGIVTRLNDGPDLASSIANTQHALELPTGSKISWQRVAPEPIQCDERYVTGIVQALQRFQDVSGKLLRKKEQVRDLIFAGVDMEPDPELRNMYLFPGVDHFSVDRADLHYRGRAGLFASEIDEMPGGFAELVHVDKVYGVNQDRWKQCFDWLFQEGPLLFLVSHNWSKVYFPEIRWLVSYLRERGYPAHFLSTEHVQELQILPDGVRYKGERIGTIWRQFPVFETQGMLKDVVRGSQQKIVRMVPEFGHFGNKAWFSVFWRYQDFFARELDSNTLSLLKEVLPDSSIVIPGKPFVSTIKGRTIGTLQELREMSEEGRNALVLKVCGANTLAARSYGVLMGHGLSQKVWADWIDERMAKDQPFIIQSRVDTAVARVAVKNTKYGHPELFSCRVLLRPWVVGGQLVSIHACAVPSSTLRVHGRVDMAIVPVEFVGMK